MTERERAVLRIMKLQLEGVKRYVKGHWGTPSEELRTEITFLENQIEVVQGLIDGKYAEWEDVQ